MLIYNQVYNIIWPKRSEYFNIELSGISKENTISIFMSFTIFLIIMLICYFTIVKPNFFFGFLITFPFIEIGLYCFPFISQATTGIWEEVRRVS